MACCTSSNDVLPSPFPISPSCSPPPRIMANTLSVATTPPHPRRGGYARETQGYQQGGSHGQGQQGNDAVKGSKVVDQALIERIENEVRPLTTILVSSMLSISFFVV